VFESGNRYSAYSADGGNTFAKTSGLSEGGATGGFPAGVSMCGCDQQVIFAPQINRFIWVRQGQQTNGAKEGDYSIAVDTPGQLKASKGQTWHFMDLTPAQFGTYMTGRGCWFDYPVVGVSEHFFLLAFSNICSTGATEAVIVRLSLSDLANSELTGSFLTSSQLGTRGGGGPVGSFGIAADAHDPDPNFAGWKDGTTQTALRVFRWDDASPAATVGDVAVSTPTDPHLGTNSALGYRITGGAQVGVGDRQAWFAWTSGPAGSMTNTHIEYVEVDSLYLVGLGNEGYVYDPTYPYGYPSLAGNSHGEVAIAYAWNNEPKGGCCALPGVGFLTGKQMLIDASPPNTVSGGSGFDYITVRPDWADPGLFAAATFYQLLPPGGPSNPGGDNHPLFQVFGRYGAGPPTPTAPQIPPIGPSCPVSPTSATVITGIAGGIGTTGAIVYASVNPNCVPTWYTFDYGTTTAYGSSVSFRYAGADATGITVEAALTGLTPSTTYHYRVRAVDALASFGSSGISVGADQTFTTSPLPPPANGPLPDLVIGVFVNGSLQPGLSRDSFWVSNQGQAAAGPFEVTVSHSTDGTYTYDFPRLAPGQSIVQSFPCVEDHVTVTIDPSNQVRESSKSNNTAQEDVGVCLS
jgi:hypothetical protein